MPKYICNYCDHKYTSHYMQPQCPVCKDFSFRKDRTEEKSDVFGYNKDPQPEDDTSLDIFTMYEGSGD